MENFNTPIDSNENSGIDYLEVNAAAPVAVQSVAELLSSMSVRDPASIPSRPAAIGAKALGYSRKRLGH